MAECFIHSLGLAVLYCLRAESLAHHLSVVASPWKRAELSHVHASSLILNSIYSLHILWASPAPLVPMPMPCMSSLFMTISEFIQDWGTCVFCVVVVCQILKSVVHVHKLRLTPQWWSNCLAMWILFLASVWYCKKSFYTYLTQCEVIN